MGDINTYLKETSVKKLNIAGKKLNIAKKLNIFGNFW